MSSTGGALVGIAVLATFGVLVAGVVNMLRGGSANTSQKLMRWRVGLQFLAILVLLAVLWARGIRPGWL